MKKIIGLAAILFLGILAFVLLLIKDENSSKNGIKSKGKKIKETATVIDINKVRLKVEKAINFLKSKIDKTYLFRDPYLMCLEARGECNSSMEVLRFASYLLSEEFEEELIRKLSDLFVNAKLIVEAEYKKMGRKKFRDYNIDVYCDFVWRYPSNPHLVNELISNYREEYNGWEDVKKYSKKGWQWKKIKNELHCTVALARLQNYSSLVEKIVEEHYQIYKEAVDRNFPNVSAFTGWFVHETVYLYKNGIDFKDKYGDVVTGFFDYLKQEVMTREGNYPQSAMFLLFLIKEYPYIYKKDKEELVKECLSILIDAIDDEGRLFPVIINGRVVAPQNLSYVTIYTLDALNLIFYFKEFVK